MNLREIEIVSHALGVKSGDKMIPRKFYRNHFSTRANSVEYPILKSMEYKGLLTERLVFGHPCFHVTEAGIMIFKENMA